MREGFLTGLRRNWFAWSGWLFTVGGAVFGLWAGGALAWIGALAATAGLLALTALAYQRHKALVDAENRHAAQIEGLGTDVRTANARAEQAERKLNEVPANILMQLEALIHRHAFAELAAALAKHVDYVARMVALAQAVTRPITLRTFVKRGEVLYVDAKLSPAAIHCLRLDDPFLLEFKNSSGLVTASAGLRVHQFIPPKEVAWFRVVRYSGEEVARVDALAEKQDVPGKGYTACPVVDTVRYANWDLADVATIVRVLTDELIRLRE